MAVNSTLETAYGQGNKTVYQAEATATTVKEVIAAQADAYKAMMGDNKLERDQVLTYMRHNLIKDYADGKIAIGLG